MSYRNERFNRRFLSLDLIGYGDNPEKRDILSDNGEGARRIRRAPDLLRDKAAPCLAARERKLAKARGLLVKAGLARLLPVLEQVVANGKNRRESICRLSKIWHVRLDVARRKYYRGSKTLLTFFSANKIKGEQHAEMTE